ncbi:alpha/beta hydrolase [Nonomuraea salmonea]|uniref:alpha/beta fold hydrolase n=1 Tax=Nonomuraea salmonea TaxID=46181 RepID=UPI002FEA1F52
MSQSTISSADGTPICYRTSGAGPGLIVLGGSLRASDDYLPLATDLSRSFTVHLVERRGRGASGPLGPGYALAREVDDLLAVQAETGARLAFGHSYGGLVILETARTSPVFERIVAYEPGVPVAPVPTAWMSPYRERLAADDPYGAFVHFIRGSGARRPSWRSCRTGICASRCASASAGRAGSGCVPSWRPTWPNTSRSPPSRASSPASRP